MVDIPEGPINLHVRFLTRLISFGFAVLLASRATAAVVIFLPLDAEAEKFHAITENESDYQLPIPGGTVLVEGDGQYLIEGAPSAGGTIEIQKPAGEMNRSVVDTGTTPEFPVRRPLIVIEAAEINFQDSLPTKIPKGLLSMTLLRIVAHGLDTAPSHVNLPPEELVVKTSALPPTATPLTAAEEISIEPAKKSAVAQNDVALDSLHLRALDVDPWSFLEEFEQVPTSLESPSGDSSNSTIEQRESAEPSLSDSPAFGGASDHPEAKFSAISGPAPTILRPAMLLTAGLLEQASRRLETWAQVISWAGQTRLAATPTGPHN